MKFVRADVHSCPKYQNVQELKYSFSLLDRLRAEIAKSFQMHFVELTRDPYLGFIYYQIIVLNNNELLFYLIIKYRTVIATVSYIVLLQPLTGTVCPEL